MPIPSEWFCALLDTAADVYFRYALASSSRGFVYVSPSVALLTGHASSEFLADAGLVRRLIASADRRLLRRMIRARRGVTVRLHLLRGDVTLPLDVRTVALVRHGRVVAIEGVARLATGAATARSAVPMSTPVDEPVQRQLAALMVEVHALLYRVLPAPADDIIARANRALRLGDLQLDPERLTVTESGRAVALTTREVLLLRYLLERRGRVVTRGQLLTDVWSYSYTGDDRTVDVHISRLRRKLPSLSGRLIAIRHIGYRLDNDEMTARVANS